MKKKISLQDVKTALLDKRFRDTLPTELSEDIRKFLRNPGCACNHPIYKNVVVKAGPQLAAYYPTMEALRTEDVEAEEAKLAQNSWTVINCSIHELRDRLRELPNGHKQLDIARWEDQVTVVVNELDLL